MILVLASAFLPGSPPKPSDSALKIAHFVRDNDDALRWAAYLSALAALPLLWWTGAIWRMMRRAEGGAPRLAVVALGGIIFSGVMSVIGGIVLGAVAIYGAGRLGPSGTRFFYILSGCIGSAALFGIALFVGAVSGAVIRTGMLPRALGWFGALVALVALRGGTGVASTRDVYFDLALAAYMGASLWVLITSGLMLAGRGAPRDPVPASAA